MNKTEIITEKSHITWIKFVIACILFLGFNFLILYFYPRNIYTDISFVLAIFFTFKFLRFNSINIFLYSVFYLVLAVIVIFIRHYILSPSLHILSYKLIDSITFYIPCFFILSFMLYLYEEKIENKITFRKKKISYLCLFCVFSVLFIFLFISFNLELITGSTKQSINRLFNKQEYYSKKEFVIIDGEEVKEEITILATSPKQGIPFSGKIYIKGWALEKNSKYDSGIDRIEFFLDGKPGEGKYLGVLTLDSLKYKSKLETMNFIVKLYMDFYGRLPTSNELYFWAINMEYSIMSHRDVAFTFINKSKFMDKSLSNEEFVIKLYKDLFNRGADTEGFKYFTGGLETDLSREDALNMFLNSEEYNKMTENYYENISIKKNDLGIIRKDIGEKYGRQFYLSGYSFELDNTAFPDGEHTLYVYAHSPVFGWDYSTINLTINNSN